MKWVHACLAAGALLANGAALAAEPKYYTEPIVAAVQRVSKAASLRDYRIDVARYLYEAYAPRIFKGRLPPLIHAVVVVETTVDANGRASDVKVVRGPSHAPDVTAAVTEMIKHAGPLPLPSLLGGAKFTEIWLVHKDGRFQLDALTEGQN